RVGVVPATYFNDCADGVAFDAGALDDVGVAQADQGAGGEAEVLGGRGVPEVVLLYIKDAAKRDLSGTGGRILGIVDGLQLLDAVLGVILDDQFQRPQHSHAPQ